MSDDLTIPFLSNELEDAGWLGLAAAGLLAPFVIGAPGANGGTGAVHLVVHQDGRVRGSLAGSAPARQDHGIGLPALV